MIIACRDVDKAECAAREIVGETQNPVQGKITIIHYLISRFDCITKNIIVTYLESKEYFPIYSSSIRFSFYELY